MMAIGDVFMQIYFTVFDRDYDRIGFAKAVHNTHEAILQYDMDGMYRNIAIYD